jgi:glycosyltransferase involved in cell wall biosynthesis
MAPAITVVIPTFNRCHMIPNAIESLQQQTFIDWELVIVDDASTDKTTDVVYSYKKKDKRIRYRKHPTNKGGNAARNLGIRSSRGKCISFLDDDDTITPDKLLRQHAFLEQNPNTGLVYSGYLYVDADTQRVVKQIPAIYRGNVLKAILRKNILGSPTPLIRRRCFEDAGLFDESLTSSQDWDMWIRIAQYHRFDYIKDYLANVNIHGQQISVNLRSKIRSRKMIYRKYAHLLDQKTRALHLRRIGVLQALNGSAIEACLSLIDAIKLNPIDRLTLIHLLLSICPPFHRSMIYRLGLLKHGNVTFYV